MFFGEQFESVGHRLAAGGRGIRDRHDHGRLGQSAPRFAGDPRSDMRLAGQQQLQNAGAELPARPCRALTLLERKPCHRDDRGHDAPALLVEVARRDRDGSAQAPAAAERLNGERGIAHAQSRARAGPASQDPPRLVVQTREDLGVEARRRMLARQCARRVEQSDPGVQLS